MINSQFKNQFFSWRDCLKAVFQWISTLQILLLQSIVINSQILLSVQIMFYVTLVDTGWLKCLNYVLSSKRATTRVLSNLMTSGSRQKILFLY